MQKIKVKCKGSINLPFDDLHILQDTEDFILKELSKDAFEGLKKSIEKRGFLFPFFVWRCEEESKWYYTDGTQRDKVLAWMRDRPEKYQLPEKFPCAEIEAANKREAAEAILTQSSRYGKITDEGLYGFVHEFEIDPDTLPEYGIPEFSMEDFRDAWFGDEQADLEEADNIPDAPEKVIIKQGDLIELGSHRLLCGDSTDKSQVEYLMGGMKAFAVLTDPPYGINQDGVPNDEAEIFETLINKAVPALPIQDGVIIAFQSTRRFPVWLDAIRQNGHTFERMLWLYKEAQCTFPWRGWILTSESILVSSTGKSNWNEIKPYSHDCYKLSEISHELSDEIGWHGAVKPQTVIRDLMQRISLENQIIFDGFGGSGTTLIAAEATKRHCMMCEISELYCHTIIDRYLEYTDQTDITINGKKVNWQEYQK